MCQPFEFGGAFDPDPLTTAAFDLRLLTVDPVIPDDETVTGDTPAVTSAQHAALIVEYLQEVLRTAKNLSNFDYGRVGVVGWGTGCITATELAETHPSIIDRIALVQADRTTHATELADALPAEPTGLEGRIERALDERAIEPAPTLVSAPGVAEPDRLPREATLRVTERGGKPLDVLVAHWPAVLSHIESHE